MSSLIKRASNGWDQFWFGTTDARPIALFRMGLGIAVLSSLFTVTPALEDLFSNAGVISQETVSRINGPAVFWLFDWSRTPWGQIAAAVGLIISLALSTRFRRARQHHGAASFEIESYSDALAAAALFFLLFGNLEDPVRLYACHLAAIAGTLLVVFGVAARPGLVFSFLWMAWLRSRGPYALASYDTLLVAGLAPMMFAPCDQSLALSAYWRRGEPRSFEVSPAWPLRLLQIQLCVVYLATAWLKFADPAWRDGTFISYLMMSSLSRWPSAEWATSEWRLTASAILTWGTLLIETYVPVLIWFRATRRWAILAGIALHVGIWIGSVVPKFSFLTIAWYMLFLNSDDFAAIGRWLDRRPRFRRLAIAVREPQSRAARWVSLLGSFDLFDRLDVVPWNHPEASKETRDSDPRAAILARTSDGKSASNGKALNEAFRRVPAAWPLWPLAFGTSRAAATEQETERAARTKVKR